MCELSALGTQALASWNTTIVTIITRMTEDEPGKLGKFDTAMAILGQGQRHLVRSLVNRILPVYVQVLSSDLSY